MGVRFIWVVGGCLLALFGCHRTFAAEVNQPNPLKMPLETLRQSEELTIITGDMDLKMPRHAASSRQGSFLTNQRYPLQNKASFTVVSRDRLRFHVQIEHKWKQYTNLSSWKVVLYDNRGRRFRPSDVDLVKARNIVEMWDYEVRTPVTDSYGQVIGFLDDGYRRREPLGHISLFRGRGDIVFYSQDIFGPEVEWVTLELERSGITFRFTWNFADPQATTHVAHR